VPVEWSAEQCPKVRQEDVNAAGGLAAAWARKIPAAMLASYLPACCAVAVDPVETLRSE
jgi:hypothetical protein